MTDSQPNAVAIMSAEPAVLGLRLLALVYDSLPMLGIWMAISALTYLARNEHVVIPGTLGAAIEFALLLASTVIYAVISWRFGGQTLGMRAFRLRVVNTHGKSAHWWPLLLRFTLGLVSLASFGLGFLWSLIDSERRTWHDLGSNTRLVKICQA